MSTKDEQDDAAVAGWAGPTETDPGSEKDEAGAVGTGKGATLDAGTDGKGVTVDGDD